MPRVVLGRLELEHTGSQHIQVAGNPYMSSGKATLPKTLNPKPKPRKAATQHRLAEQERHQATERAKGGFRVRG